MLNIEINEERETPPLNTSRLAAAAQAVLRDAGIAEAEISIVVVTDARMQELNRQFLNHDYPTDVLSFLLDHDAAAKSLSGEIVVSADYAVAQASRYGWTADDELLLYVIHGCLHLVGHDDATAAAKQAMREAEAKYLARFGLEHRYDDQ